MKSEAWVKALRAELKRRADPERAPKMQAYMKSKLPYAGVPMPDLRVLVRELEAPAFTSFAELDAFVRTVFAGAKVREEKYAALQILASKAAKPFRTFEAKDLYEWLLVEGAWWDLVDEVAAHRVMEWFAIDEKKTAKILRAWSHSENLWLRRTAIIAQVVRKDVDTDLLFEMIEPALGEKEFFLRKAIGWGLRAAAKKKPRDVESFLDGNRERLSGLSIREAEKGLAAAAR